jgi:FtsH-binding integral membrane protein
MQSRTFGLRSIAGATDTAGVSDRIAFLRRTYALLGAALVALAAFAGGMMIFAPETSIAMSRWALSGSLNWLLVLALFMGVGYISERLAWSDTSRGLQFLGLGIGVIAQGLILQPLLWVAMLRFGATGGLSIIAQATVITIAIFVGLTLTVFITKKDFSFLRGALVIATFAALGVILASMLFGFSLGAIFAGVMVLLMAGYILYQTSIVMKEFPPTAYVAAALMLFSTVATLFWYILQLLMSLRRE